MYGLTGYVRIVPASPEAVTICLMSEKQRHHGPDDFGDMGINTGAGTGISSASSFQKAAATDIPGLSGDRPVLGAVCNFRSSIRLCIQPERLVSYTSGSNAVYSGPCLSPGCLCFSRKYRFRAQWRAHVDSADVF